MRWSTVQMDVEVEYDDFERAREEAIDRGGDTSVLTVSATVDIDEALQEATIDQLRDALGREAPGYTEEQLDAIRDCFTALASGHEIVALSLLPRVFGHLAQVQAAEAGVRAACHARAA